MFIRKDCEKIQNERLLQEHGLGERTCMRSVAAVMVDISLSNVILMDQKTSKCAGESGESMDCSQREWAMLTTSLTSMLMTHPSVPCKVK